MMTKQEAPPKGVLDPGWWHSQLSSECDPGNDHPEQASMQGSWGPKALGREAELAGSASGTMTHEGDYVVLFIAKNKNF